MKRRTCTLCSATEEQTIPINPNAHSWAENITYSATHPHEGSRDCLLCGASHPDAPFTYHGTFPGCSMCVVLNAPENLKIANTENNTVIVSWNTVNGATGYRLERDGIVVYDGMNNNYFSFNLKTGFTYNFRVKAYNENTESNYSEIQSVCIGVLNPILIYKTRRSETNWFSDEKNNSIPESLTPDLLFGDMKKADIEKNTHINDSDFDESYIERVNIFKGMAQTWFSNDIFKSIIGDMIDHFSGISDYNFIDTIEGYKVYENSSLTEQVKRHRESVDYVNSVKSALDKCLKKYSGNIDELTYYIDLKNTPDLRKIHPVVKQLLDDGIKQPGFPFNKDNNLADGFTISIDSLHGNMFEITSYKLDGNNYCGTIRFTYYDHFGLDIDDMDKSWDPKDTVIGMLSGFKQWFILQHWDNIGNMQPKPFITWIQFETTFSGTII